jgi:hypothetical protein
MDKFPVQWSAREALAKLGVKLWVGELASGTGSSTERRRETVQELIYAL